MLSIFKPAPHRARLPEAEIDPLYRRLRWQIFLGIFFGYAAYYLVRKNFALAMPYLVEQGFSRGDLGFALSGISIAYGFSKFIMGSVSDRSNPRIFLPAGLILAALVMLVMGFVPWATSSIMVMFVLLFLLSGSVIIPLKALVLNALSLTATFGALVWIFQEGHGSSLIGFTPIGGVESYVVVVAMAFGFGLGELVIH